MCLPMYVSFCISLKISISTSLVRYLKYIDAKIILHKIFNL